MPKEVNPRGRLEERESDINLPPRHYLKLSLFAGLKKPPDLDKFPGSLVIRRLRRKEELFRQGEPGWTAFYLLTLEDVLTIRQLQLESATDEPRRRELREEIERLKIALVGREDMPDDHPDRHVATVNMATLKKKDVRYTTMMMERVKSRPSAPIKNLQNQTVYIPYGYAGPQTVSWEAGKVPLFEGELFGEMSCLYRTPRSATVVAERDCFVIEFLRNILDKVYRDPVYKKKADDIYLKRVLELQVRKMPIFRDLTAKEFEEIRSGVELESFEPGDLICDEHERSDCMYLVRQGLVKVMKNVSFLLGPSDVTDWVALGEALRKGKATPASPHGKFWALLPEKARALLPDTVELAKLGPADRTELLYTINEVLKDHKLAEAAEFKPIVESESFKAQLQGFPADRKKWSEGQVRQFNRLLFDGL